jgi:hypothetical protein
VVRTGDGRLKDVGLCAHREDAEAENIRWLLELGEHPERIAKRLGITLDVLEQRLRRH